MESRNDDHPDDGADRHDHDAHASQEGSSGHGDPHGVVPSVYRDPAHAAALIERVDEQVRAALRRRGFDEETTAEVTQEAWLRLFARAPLLKSPTHVARWLSLVAYRLAEQSRRKQSRRSRRLADAPVPDPGVPDVAQSVEARAQLDEFLKAFRSLSDIDRGVLLTAANEANRGATRRERDAVSLRIMRARRRLREKLDGWLVGIPLGWTFSRRSEPRLSASAGLIGVSAALAVTLTAGGHVVPSASTEKVSATTAGLLAGDPPSHELVLVGSSPVSAPSTSPASASRGRETTTSSSPPVVRPDRSVIVVGAGGRPHAVVGEDRREDRELLCYGNFPIMGSQCVAHPSDGLPMPVAIPGR